jgi:hypothetical protein
MPDIKFHRTLHYAYCQKLDRAACNSDALALGSIRVRFELSNPPQHKKLRPTLVLRVHGHARTRCGRHATGELTRAVNLDLSPRRQCSAFECLFEEPIHVR